jgi:steroid 5-alpha reductase family enzyme
LQGWRISPATFVIFGFSTFYRNSSLYDPYWSVAPVPIAVYWALNPAVTGVSRMRQVLAISLVSLWAVRLTYNWLRRWEGLVDEDWRYSDLRRKTGRWYWLVDLTGIHLFPTVQVFLACLALFPVLSLGTGPLGMLDAIASVITLGAIWIEATADKQLHRFLQAEKKSGEILNKGLWAYSRHPNYFGEIMFWWGLYLLGLAADPSYWWTVMGPLSITLMFLFISIPMIDKRSLERRPHYAGHMKRVSACIPWFPRR